MKLYGISGLGADKRVFQHLTLDYPIIPVDWIVPFANESIESYAFRLSKAIHTDEEFGVVGVSFGGLVATEISKLLNPKIIILISTIETKHELNPLLRFMGWANLVKLIPVSLFNPPRALAYYFFGTHQKQLLDSILEDTDFKFVKWAIGELLTWENEVRLATVFRIHGEKDRLLSVYKKDSKIFFIKDGGHFMVVDKAKEISCLINNAIKSRLAVK